MWPRTELAVTVAPDLGGQLAGPEMDVLGASEFKHAVQHVEGDGTLGFLAPIGLRAWAVTMTRFHRAMPASTRVRQVYPDTRCQPCGRAQQCTAYVASAALAQSQPYFSSPRLIGVGS